MRFWRLAAVLVAGLPVAAGAAAGAVLDEVRACVEQNTPRRSQVMTIALEYRDRAGEVSESRFKLYWRRLSTDERRVLMRFSAPEDLVGAAVLVHGVRRARPNVYLYLPGIGKPRRVTSRQQLEGFLGRADLGIEEIGLLLDPVGADALQLVGDGADERGRATWILETRQDVSPDDPGRYPRTRTLVDQEFCIPLGADFYDADDNAAKQLRVDPTRVTREAQSWIPRELVFTDVSGESVTTLRIDEVEVDIPLAPSLLTVPAMAGGGAR